MRQTPDGSMTHLQSRLLCKAIQLCQLLDAEPSQAGAAPRQQLRQRLPLRLWHLADGTFHLALQPIQRQLQVAQEG